MASLTGTQIVSLAGYQGSGKSTIGNRLSRLLNIHHVEVSDVVKAHYKGLTREQLPDTMKLGSRWLTDALFEEIQDYTHVVITGPRQKEIFRSWKRRGAEVWSFWIAAHQRDRYERLYKLGKVDSIDAFLQHELKERKMDLPLIRQSYTSFTIHSDRKTDPDGLAFKIGTVLEQRGFKV